MEILTAILLSFKEVRPCLAIDFRTCIIWRFMLLSGEFGCASSRVN